MLSGVARCGICDAPLYAIYPHKGAGDPSRTYSCRASGGANVARLGALLDEYVEALLLGWFSRPKDRKRLSALLNGGRNLDVKALQAVCRVSGHSAEGGAMSYTTIEIYCDDQKYHPGRVCTVRRLRAHRAR
jgi:hypothetical protein